MPPHIATTLINTYRANTDLFIHGSSLYTVSRGYHTRGPTGHANVCDSHNSSHPQSAQFSKPGTPMMPLRLEVLNTCGHGGMNYSLGPAYGYNANALKTWLITKQQYLQTAKEAFKGTLVNITTEGRSHLGAPLGTREYIEQYVNKKVTEWCSELEKLTSIAETQPHAAYAAITHGLASKWNYISRTTPNIGNLLNPIEDTLRTKLIPKLTGRPPPNDAERDLLALPVRLGGIGVSNPSKRPSEEFVASLQVTGPLKSLISEKNPEYPVEALEEYNMRRSQQQESACLLKPSLGSSYNVQ